MSDINELGEILGSVMTALVQARKIADMETAALAEFYKEHPLLEGMSLPRVRVPEMTLDVPVIIEHTRLVIEGSTILLKRSPLH